jgi:hypothetical protein
VVETPDYDTTIFKVHYGKMTLKIYSKGEHVLRIEVIVHMKRSGPACVISSPIWASPPDYRQFIFHPCA